MFTWEDGHPYSPDYVSHTFHKLLKKHDQKIKRPSDQILLEVALYLIDILLPYQKYQNLNNLTVPNHQLLKGNNLDKNF